MLEKPSDLLDARDMLEALSGRVHQVMTAVALATPERCDVRLVTTNVAFGASWTRPRSKPTGAPARTVRQGGRLCYPGHCRQIRQSPRGELQCRGRPALLETDLLIKQHLEQTR